MGSIILIWAIVGGAAILGALIGDLIASRRHKSQLAEIGGEVMRLQNIAKSKLATDDQQLPALMTNLNKAVEQTYRAAEAFDKQSALTRQKTEGARELISASNRLIGMMEDYGANAPLIDAEKVRSLPAVKQSRRDTVRTER